MRFLLISDSTKLKHDDVCAPPFMMGLFGPKINYMFLRQPSVTFNHKNGFLAFPYIINVSLIWMPWPPFALLIGWWLNFVAPFLQFIKD